VDSFATLPILTRADLVHSFDALTAATLPVPRRDIGLSVTTGSTGLPAKVLNTPQSRNMFHVLWHRCARWYRFDVSQRFARIRIAPDLASKANGEPLGEGESLTLPTWQYIQRSFQTGDEVHFTNNNPRDAQIAWLAEKNPAYLLTYPGLMEEIVLANDCKAIPGLQSVMLISSILTTSMRSRIENALQVPVHQNYGLNEVGLVATRCDAGRYHSNPEMAHVEIVDEDGIPVRDGESGRLVVTSLMNKAMPLIRYDTGDIATACAGACPCGRTLPSFAQILGRYIRFAGTPPQTRLRLNGLLAVLSDMPNTLFRNIRQYQIHQSRNADFEFRMVCAGPVEPEFSRRLMTQWKSLNEKDPWALRIVTVDAIETTPSGKQLDFVSDFQELDSDFAQR
jgi:phenylacetate-CoA ligase